MGPNFFDQEVTLLLSHLLSFVSLFYFQVYFEIPSEPLVESQYGEGTIFSPCENLSNDLNNNELKMKKREWEDMEREEGECGCPNSLNITWNLQVDNGLRFFSPQSTIKHACAAIYVQSPHSQKQSKLGSITHEQKNLLEAKIQQISIFRQGIKILVVVLVSLLFYSTTNENNQLIFWASLG